MRCMILLPVFISLTAAAQQSREEVLSKGNEFYKKAEYLKAADQYQKALQADPHDALASFNLSNAYYRQDQKVEATKILSGILPDVKAKEIRNRIYYNKGVILTDQKNVEESIEAYKNALRQDPNDKEARENLQKALLELKRKTPPPPPKENKKQQQQQQQKKPQSKLDQKQTQQRLQLLQEKEKQVQERIQREKNKGMGGSNNKDW